MGKGGIVRDVAVHRAVLRQVISGIAGFGISPLMLTFSPIKGADGNIEYLLYSRKEEICHDDITDDIIDEVVRLSHEM